MSVKWGLTAREEKQFIKAQSAFEKFNKESEKFYKSISDRFEKAGFNGEEIVEDLIAGDNYVFGLECSHSDYGYGDISVWYILKQRYGKKRK